MDEIQISLKYVQFSLSEQWRTSTAQIDFC